MGTFRLARSRRTRLAVLLATSTVASVLGLAPTADAATWSVKCDEDKLIEAINNANGNGAADTISLKKGCTYEFEWADNDKNALPVIVDDTGTPAVDLVINGNGAKLERSDDDDAQEFRLLEIGDDAGVVIKDLTVTGGYLTDPSGGGIEVGPDASLTATNLKVLDNELFSVGDDPQASVGGGITCNRCAELALNKSTVADNKATTIDTDSGAFVMGGGIAANGGDVTLLRTSVKGNDAHSRGLSYGELFGGGIGVLASTSLTLERSSVTRNIAEARGTDDPNAFGGGVFAGFTPDVDILESEISGNKATAYGAGGTFAGGGGLFLADSPTSIVESEIVKNTAQATGPGIIAHGGGIYQADGSLTVDSGDEDESSEISDNKVIAEGFGAQALGGGFFFSRIEGGAVSAEFNFTEFEGNKATSPEGTARGGGLYLGAVEAGGVVLNQTEVEENEVDSTYIEQGGGVYTECPENVDYDLSDIEDNEPDDIFEADNCIDNA